MLGSLLQQPCSGLQAEEANAEREGCSFQQQTGAAVAQGSPEQPPAAGRGGRAPAAGERGGAPLASAAAAGRHRAAVPSGGSGAASERPGLRAYLYLEGFSSFTVEAVEFFYPKVHSGQRCRDRSP